MKIRTWLNALLILVPATVVVWYFAQQSAYSRQITVLLFVLALVSLVPLASLIGTFTDRLEVYLGDRAGGLIGASFANVPELAIGTALLIHAHVNAGSPSIVLDDLDIVRGLLIGSVINNVLFVLGSSIFIAALRNGRMNFSAESAAGYASMLALAVVGLALPRLAVSLLPAGHHQQEISTELAISVPFGIILMVSYGCYIAATIFKVGAHKQKKVLEEESLEKLELPQSPKGALVGLVAADAQEDILAGSGGSGTYETELQSTIDLVDQEEEVEEGQRAELRRKNP